MPPRRGLLALLALLLALLGVPGGSWEGASEHAEAQRSNHRSRGSASRARPSKAQSRRAPSRSRSSSRANARARERARAAAAAYRRQVVRWHRRPSAHEVERWAQQSPPPLVFRPVRYRGEYALVPDESGVFSSYQLRAARKAFTYRDALTHDVHPRLMELAYRITQEFRAPYVWLISGYRETRSTSRHSQGRAMDIVVPGVSNAQLARFARTFGYVGVGEYPQSGFVHVDVRARSYFWVDSSAPGARSRERQVRRSEAQRADRAARARGEHPVSEVADEPDGAEGPDEVDTTGIDDVDAGADADAEADMDASVAPSAGQ